MTQVFHTDSDRLLVGQDGKTLSKGSVEFYDHRNGNLTPVYGDSQRKVPLTQPVVASNSGILPTIYLDAGVDYGARISDKKGNLVRDIYPIQRHSSGITVLDNIADLKSYSGPEKFVMMWDEKGCPAYYKRLTACEGLPKEDLPNVVQVDCNNVWILSDCKPKIDICSAEAVKLSCNSYVLVQECTSTHAQAADPAITADASEAAHDQAAQSKNDCGCGGKVDTESTAHALADDAQEAEDAKAAARLANPAPNSNAKVGKASIYDLVNTAVNCAPKECIRSDSLELALQNGRLVRGERLPEDIRSSRGDGYYSSCIPVIPANSADQISNHVQLDAIAFGNTQTEKFPVIKIDNPSPCARRYEIRAINRLHRVREPSETGYFPMLVPDVPANFQTRMGELGDARLNATWGIEDHNNSSTSAWLEKFSIADSYMGSQKTGVTGPNGSVNNWLGNVTFTENSLFVEVPGSGSVTYAVKFHLYWDTHWKPNQIPRERIHYASRIIAVRIR